MNLKLSLVIPAKDKNDKKLAELLRSIEAQDFPKDEMETLVITEGTSESAKAIGIRQAKGEVIGILASDNEMTYPTFLSTMLRDFPVVDATTTRFYFYKKDDDILNRYFALIGGNDPLSLYMGKNDREPFWNRDNDVSPEEWRRYIGKHECTIGDNGFFIKKNLIEDTDLENYYHIDNAIEAVLSGDGNINKIHTDIWHKTGGNIFKFFAKRYSYGLQHAFNPNRRWHLVDFRQPKDIVRLIWFIICSLTLIQPLLLSVKGWLKIKDVAWFLHPVVCGMTLGTYSILVIHLGLRKLSQSLFVPTVGRRA